MYFTKERFNLFYPSYGDTYPTDKGAIGMTFEQSGIRAGLGVITEDGDTLTLVDRALHHFTNGLSTVEVSSVNSASLIKNIKSFSAIVKPMGWGNIKPMLLKRMLNLLLHP